MSHHIYHRVHSWPFASVNDTKATSPHFVFQNLSIRLLPRWSHIRGSFNVVKIRAQHTICALRPKPDLRIITYADNSLRSCLILTLVTMSRTHFLRLLPKETRKETHYFLHNYNGLPQEPVTESLKNTERSYPANSTKIVNRNYYTWKEGDIPSHRGKAI